MFPEAILPIWTAFTFIWDRQSAAIACESGRYDFLYEPRLLDVKDSDLGNRFDLSEADKLRGQELSGFVLWYVKWSGSFDYVHLGVCCEISVLC